MTSLHSSLVRLRRSLVCGPFNSNGTLPAIDTTNDSSSTARRPAKQRSDSEPNILINRQSIVAITDQF
jgi:hypothetical protein